MSNIGFHALSFYIFQSHLLSIHNMTVKNAAPNDACRFDITDKPEVDSSDVAQVLTQQYTYLIQVSTFVTYMRCMRLIHPQCCTANAI